MHSDNDYTQCELGMGDERLGTANQQELADAIVQMCSQANKLVRISSPSLNQELFNTEVLADALSRLARSSRHAEVRLLISNSRALVGSGHRLLSLSRRLSTGVIMRRWQIDEHEPHPEFVVVDNCGVIEMPSREDEPAHIQFNNRVRANALSLEFDAIWQKSKTTSELRSLSL